MKEMSSIFQKNMTKNEYDERWTFRKIGGGKKFLGVNTFKISKNCKNRIQVLQKCDCVYFHCYDNHIYIVHTKIYTRRNSKWENKMFTIENSVTYT